MTTNSNYEPMRVHRTPKMRASTDRTRTKASKMASKARRNRYKGN